MISSMAFFFNDTATTEIYTLSLHDALPISSASTPPQESKIITACAPASICVFRYSATASALTCRIRCIRDRKSTRLNSSHTVISYAVFCLQAQTERRATRDELAPMRDARID